MAKDSTPIKAKTWRHCNTHGDFGPQEWGCPDCVYEMRRELLDAREVVEAADNFLQSTSYPYPDIKWAKLRELVRKLEAANKEYWRKWGEKEEGK